MTFYRYVRPVKFDEKRLELNTNPRGGICLRFDENADGTLNFVHARCHEDELFSKDVAKRMVDWRASHPSFTARIPSTKKTEVLLEDVMTWCLDWQPGTDEYVTLYTMYELRCLGAALAELLTKNLQEEHKAAVWRAGIESIKTTEMYERMDSAQAPGNG
jgi:hypothetical protein